MHLSRTLNQLDHPPAELPNDMTGFKEAAIFLVLWITLYAVLKLILYRAPHWSQNPHPFRAKDFPASLKSGISIVHIA